MKALKFYLLVLAAFITVLFVSCVTTEVSFGDTDAEMSIFAAEEGVLETRHYSAEEMRKWNVLVLDTKNTKRSIDMLAKLSADMIKYHNKKAAEDCNTKAIIEYQNNQLKKIFHSVAFEGKSGETYDFVILRDCYILPGSRSGNITGTVLAYQFVYPVTADMEMTDKSKFLFRGFISFEGYGTIPYPANSYAVQDSNKNASDAVTAKLSEGIDLLTLPGEERKFLATDEALAALNKEVEIYPETVNVGVNSNASTNTVGSKTANNEKAGTKTATVGVNAENTTTKTSTSATQSSGKSSAYTSAKFKALLEKQ